MACARPGQPAPRRRASLGTLRPCASAAPRPGQRGIGHEVAVQVERVVPPFGPVPGSVGPEQPALLAVEQVRHHHLVEHLIVHRRVADRHHHFDPAVEIAAHGVARGDVDPGVVVGQRGAAGEGPDAAVFEKPPDDRLDRDVVRKPRHAGSQAADAAHHQADLDPGRAGVVEPLDQLRIGQRVELGPDRRGLAFARAGDLAIDAFVQPGAHRQRRDRQHFGRGRFDIAGDEIEQPAGVAAGLGIGGEEAQVGIDPRGDRVIVAGAEVAVSAVASPSRRTTSETLAWVFQSTKP